MKTLMMIIMMMMSGSAMALDACFTGSWYDPLTNNAEGLNLEVLDNQVVGYYYTWYEDHRNVYTMSGVNDIDGAAVMDTYTSYKSDAGYQVQWVGVSDITILNANNLMFHHSFKYDFLRENWTTPWCFYICDDTKWFERLTQPIACGE